MGIESGPLACQANSLPIELPRPVRKDAASNLPAQTLLPTTPVGCGLKPTCPYTYQQPRKDAASNLPANKPGKMWSQTYLPIHSHRQPQQGAVSNPSAHKPLPTTPERCSLKPAWLYIYRQARKDVASNLPAHTCLSTCPYDTLLPTTPERCGLKPNCPYTLTDKPGKMPLNTSPVSNLLPQTIFFHLPTNPKRFRFTPVSNLPAHTLTNKPGKMPLN